MTKYICNDMRLADEWTAIVLTFGSNADTREVKVVFKDPHPFRNGKYKAAVIEQVSAAATDELYGPVLAGQAQAVRTFRTNLEALAKALLSSPTAMLERAKHLQDLCDIFRRDIEEDGIAAFACWQSVVKMLNSFADGIPADDTIHTDPAKEEIAEAHEKPSAAQTAGEPAPEPAAPKEKKRTRPAVRRKTRSDKGGTHKTRISKILD